MSIMSGISRSSKKSFRSKVDVSKIQSNYTESVRKYAMKSQWPKNGQFDDKFTYGDQMPEDTVKHIVIGEHQESFKEAVIKIYKKVDS